MFESAYPFKGKWLAKIDLSLIEAFLQEAVNRGLVMDSNFTQRWINRFRILTLSLIFSGALNIGLIAAFITKTMQDRAKTFSVSAPKTTESVEGETNQKLIMSYSHLTFRELCALLTNTDFVEDGYRKRDLALASLVSFYDFNLEKAIGVEIAQRRTLKIDEERTLELFPNLSDDQFQAVLHYAYLEQWPLTSRGLFKALQKKGQPRDPTLMQAFSVTPEFYALQSLFQKTDATIAPDILISLVADGNWQMLDGFVREQAQMQDLSNERRERLLLSYLALQSPTAAGLLLQTDSTFALKRLDDQGILALIELAPAGEPLRKFCIELIQSARSDAVWEKSAQILYRIANEEMPQPFDRKLVLTRFAPEALKNEMTKKNIGNALSTTRARGINPEANGSFEKKVTSTAANAAATPRVPIKPESNVGGEKKTVSAPANVARAQTKPEPNGAGEKKAASVSANVSTTLRTHVVKAGENLWKIARDYHVKTEDLIQINHLENDQIKPGTILKIPVQGTGSKPPR